MGWLWFSRPRIRITGPGSATVRTSGWPLGEDHYVGHERHRVLGEIGWYFVGRHGTLERADDRLNRRLERARQKWERGRGG